MWGTQDPYGEGGCLGNSLESFSRTERSSRDPFDSDSTSSRDYTRGGDPSEARGNSECARNHPRVSHLSSSQWAIPRGSPFSRRDAACNQRHYRDASLKWKWSHPDLTQRVSSWLKLRVKASRWELSYLGKDQVQGWGWSENFGKRSIPHLRANHSTRRPWGPEGFGWWTTLDGRWTSSKKDWVMKTIKFISFYFPF